MGERLDKVMVEREIVLTRSQARMLIKQGDVYVNDENILKPGHNTSVSDKIIIKERKLYVSRGAYKLERAIEEFKIDFTGLTVMDCGASTGGFTQICLEGNAKKIYALDVGHGQLNGIIESDDRVVNKEGLNLKFAFDLEEKADAFVMDISFISIKLVIDNIIKNLKENSFGVLLIKPQFEIGKGGLGKNGIVPPSDALICAHEVHAWLKTKFKNVSDLIESPVKGKAGNIEYLVRVEG